MDLKELKNKKDNSSKRMPVLFVGHGSPMNAIQNNMYTEGWKAIGESIPVPDSIICISAHWETGGTFFTAMDKPETIHDFGGFPRELYEVEYPAHGSSKIAKDASNLITNANAQLDMEWGLDHGCWSILRHMYPKADIPVIQMSLDYRKDAGYHYELAKELVSLRNKNVLILGSGNMVHNLRIIDWQQTSDKGFDWAEEAREQMKKLISDNNYSDLINYKKLGREISLAVPTPEHFLPMLYALALKEENEQITFFNDKIDLGSIAMTSFVIN